ncbi:hypothetical protein [Asticcacaulis sp. 201]|uniref:hypothetical protein n=1 Tax=Asticcacaulis sp. 201 TaxID=3028787 RepID=UPI002916963E|nr:hypothetical protein [Asticcacaulis sp. 201]MDV6330140.1 hypothetical protein [Asticcacaulis sp. 201]
MLQTQELPPAAEPRKGREIAIDEASIAFMGRVARSIPMPEDSLTQSPVRDLTAGMQSLIEKLRSLNMEKLFRSQGPLSQLTGADIEAKMRFDLGVRQVSADVRDLQAKAYSAKRLRHDLRRTRAQILAEQERLHRVIAAGRRAIAADPGADPFLMDRFQRRLANLDALQASNDVTCAQITLADTNMTALIDRLDDVTTTLFNLWQRDALAVAQSAKPVKKSSPLALAFVRTHDAFLAKLF